MATGRLGSGLSLLGQILLGTDNATAEIDRSINDTMSLVDTAYENLHTQNLTDTLSITDTVSVSRPVLESASSVITLSDVSVTGNKNASASDVITFSDATHAGVPIDAVASDTVVLSDSSHAGLLAASASSSVSLTDLAEGDLNTTILRLPAQPLNLTDHVTLGQSNFKSVVDTATLVDEVQLGSPILVSVETPLSVLVPNDPVNPTSFTFTGLIDTVDVHYAVSNQTLVDFASFSDSVNRIVEVSASSALVLTDLAEHLNLQVQDQLSLHDIAVADISNNTTDIVSLTDSVSFNRNANPAITDPLEIEQVVGWVTDNIDLCNYAPHGSLDPAPTLGNAVLTLTWPYVGPTKTVVLRNPDFNNQDNLGITRVNRESRGGTLIIYADTLWPKFKTLVIQISGLGCGTDVDNLQDFLTSSLGQEIGLLDSQNRQWKGVILNPELSLTEPDTAGKQVQLQFEGDLV